MENGPSIGGQLRTYDKRGTTLGVSEHELSRVQEVPAQARQGRSTVQSVTGERVPERGEMSAHLVAASEMNPDLHQAMSAVVLCAQ